MADVATGFRRGLAVDPFRHFRNVHWAGGTFIVKGWAGQLLRGKGSKKNDWESLGDPPPFNIFGGTFANSGSSSAPPQFAKSVFVISAKHEDEESGNEGSVILASRDARNWEIVFKQYEVNEGNLRSPWILDPTGIVWDQKESAFFASFYQADWDSTNEETTGNVLNPDGELIMRSTDGFTWVEHSKNISGDNRLTDDTPSELKPHCNKPENEGGIPDGLQAWQEGTSTFMKPQSLTGFSPVNGALYGEPGSPVANAVTVRRGEVTFTRAVSAPCYAVAVYNGIWIAAGGETGTNTPDGLVGAYLSIDVSTDGGDNWDQVYKEYKQNESQSAGFHAATVSGGKYTSSKP